MISGALELPGQNGNSGALYNTYNGITNYQPRIGVAYSLDNNTVIRSAYTLSNYLEGTGTNLRLTINPPFAHETDATYTSQVAADLDAEPGLFCLSKPIRPIRSQAP